MLCEVCDRYGTSAPTCNCAVWLSSTSNCGEDSTSTVVMFCNAASVSLMPLPLNSVAVMPPVAAPLIAWVSEEPLNRNCVPYCSWSFSVTSAITASMRTCKGRISTLRSIASTAPSSCWVE